MEGTLDALSGSERFTLRRELGRGGMGVVYDAFDRDWNVRVAVKTLRAIEPEALLRLKNEFRAISGIHHPNLVRLGELLEENGRWLFTMELVDGIDFVRWARQRLPVDEERLLAAVRQLAQGLRALHTAGRVHRDVKPSNVLVTPGGRVVLLDFGLITRVAADDALTGGLVVGTVEYMAPEQTTGAMVTPAADWYAVGVMLFEALSGHLPFAGTAPEIVAAKQGEAPPVPSSASPELQRLCRGLLEPDPDRRFGWQELATALAVPSGPMDVGTLETPFVGRADELAALDQAWKDARAGERITVFVDGESGIGKSTLVHEWMRAQHERVDELLVLESHASDRELVPFNGFDGIVDGLLHHLHELPPQDVERLLPDDTDALAAVFPVLQRVGQIIDRHGRRGPPPTEPAQARRRRAFGALRELFARLAARRPLLLVIDDFQWADDDSLALRRAVMAGDGGAGRLLVATVRTSHGHGHGEVAGESGSAADADFQRRALLGADERPGQVRWIHLARLSDEESRALVAMLCGPRVPDEKAILREAEGHPLFLAQIARSRREPTRPTGDLHATIRARVGALPAEARRLVEVLAVAGGPVRQSIAAPAADLDGEQYPLAVDEVRAAGLVRVAGSGLFAGIQTYHDQIRQAVVEGLAPERRRELHRSLAEVIEWAAGGTEPRMLFLQWLGAGDTERAARAAEQAAEDADRQLAFDLAAGYYARAISLRPERRHALDPLRARALANAGRKRKAVAAYRDAAARETGETRLELLRRAAEVLLRSGDIDEGVSILRTVLAELRMPWPVGRRALALSLIVGRVRARLRGLRFSERAESEASPQDLVRIDTAWSVTMALTMVDRARGADFQFRGLRMALDVGEPYRVARALCAEAGYSSMAGSAGRERTRLVLAEARRIAERCGHPHALALLHAVEGLSRFMLGELRRGTQDLGASRAALRAQGSRWDLLNAEHLHLMALGLTGELAQLAELSAPLVEEARASEDHYMLANVCAGHAALAPLARGDVARARALTDEAMRGWSQRGFHRQHWLEVIARVHYDLYQGAFAQAWERIVQVWRPLEKSRLLRTQFMRIVAFELRARAALATGRVEEAEREAAALVHENAAWADALSSLVRAQLYPERSAFLGAARLLADVGLRIHAAVARRRAGEDDPWWREQRVADPDAFVRCFAPGGRS